MFETFMEGYTETIIRFDANRSQTDRKLTAKKRTQTVMASVHFDVVFTRSSVFVDVSYLVSALENSNSSRFSISPECSLLAVSILERPGLQVWIFAMCHFYVGFVRSFAIILRWFVDRFDISLEEKKKATKQHQCDIDKGTRPAENHNSQFNPIHIFIWFGDHRIQDTYLEFISLSGFDFYNPWEAQSRSLC